LSGKGAEILTVFRVVVSSVVNICFTFEIVWVQPDDLSFYRASHPSESSLLYRIENGRCLGEIQRQRPFISEKYSIVLLFQSASCIGYWCV